MDQLKNAWRWLVRHHFWVLSLVVVAVALFCWKRGASALWAEYKANRATIDGQFSAADGVKNKGVYPNDKVQAKQSEQITQQQQLVSDLWKQLYERQTASVLKWPSNLSEEFRNYVAKLKFGEEIPRNLRAQYNNYIGDHFPELPKIVGALPAQPGETGGSYGAGGASFNINSFLESRRTSGPGRGGEVGGTGQELADDPDFLVIWADQALVRDELAPRSTPSSKRIWKTQEDLWVYEALLTIIANTNKAAGADRFSNAAVRVIESLEVGKAAAQASRGKGRIDVVAQPGAEAGMGMGMGGEMGMPMGEGASPEMGPGRDMGMMGGEMGGEMGGMGGELSADSTLLTNRYVDGNGAPIADPGDGNPAAFGVEFKRLPVRMKLWMDQRYLPKLITECANAPLQVEVQEVRINPPADGATGGGGYGGGMAYGSAGPGYGASPTEGMAPDAEPNMKSIVVQGTVYIFNPPSSTPAGAEAGQTAGMQ